MNIKDSRYAGKRIVITGGSSGIGRELAGRFADRGASLVLLARDGQKLQACERELSGRLSPTARVKTYRCDVADPTAVSETFDHIVKDDGAVDILINSAGILAEGYFQEQDLEVFRRIMDTNFFGTLHCIQAVVPHFERQGTGWIVNLSSMGGLIGAFGYSAYCASKHAIVGLSSTIRMELKPRNIRVQVVCPPEFKSPMVDELNTYRTRENRRVTHTIPVMQLADVADDILRGMVRGEFCIIPGRMTRALDWVNRLAPGLTHRIGDARLAKVYKGPG